MELHVVIKQIVSQHDANIVTEPRLAYMLSDLKGFEECQAMNKIMRDTIKQGYAKKIFDGTYCGKADIAQFASLTKYRDDLVAYAFDSLLFALGKRAAVTVPISIGYDPYQIGPRVVPPAPKQKPFKPLSPILALLRQKSAKSFAKGRLWDDLYSKLDEYDELVRKKQEEIDCQVAKIDQYAASVEDRLQRYMGEIEQLAQNQTMKWDSIRKQIESLNKKEPGKSIFDFLTHKSNP